MTVLQLRGMLFEIPYPVEVAGNSVDANVPGRYLAELVYAQAEPRGGHVEVFVFTGPKVFSDGTLSKHRHRFVSDDNALTEVKISARNAAASAATRTLTGADHGSTS